MNFDGLMVSVSGVRGRVGEALTPEVACQFAGAFGAFSIGRSSSRTIVVGRDSRVSGPMFHRAVIAALQSVGADVVDIGMAPTPTVQMAVEHLHAAGGLAITASHNPVEWNALKFISSSGLFLDAAEGAAMRAVLEGGIPRATWDALGTVRSDDTRDRTASRRHPGAPVHRRRRNSLACLPCGARYLPWRRRDRVSGAAGAPGMPSERDQPRAARALPSSAGAGGGEPRRTRTARAG